MGFHLPVGLLGNLLAAFALGIDSTPPFLSQSVNEKTRDSVDELASAFLPGLLMVATTRTQNVSCAVTDIVESE